MIQTIEDPANSEIGVLICEKKDVPSMANREIILFHDNALSHLAHRTQDFI